MKDEYVGDEFYSIEAILSENQKIPTTFNISVPNLGFLEGDSDSRDIHKGVTLALPFWIGDYLSTHPSYDPVSLTLPKPYSPRVRQALNADAQSVNLKSLTGGTGLSGAGYWYQMGIRLDNVVRDETLRDTLINAFNKRFLEIYDQSQHTSASSSGSIAGLGTSMASVGESQSTAFITGLDEWERELFMAGEQSAKVMKVYLEKGPNHVAPHANGS